MRSSHRSLPRRLRGVLLVAVVALLAGGSFALALDEPAREPQRPPVVSPSIAEACAELAPKLVGMPLGDAESRAEGAGCLVRVAKEDGRGLMLTADLVPTRIDVATRSGTVESIEFLG